jgi:hypothetical protein
MVAYTPPLVHDRYAVRRVNTGDPVLMCACGDRTREGVHTATLCRYVSSPPSRNSTGK